MKKKQQDLFDKGKSWQDHWQGMPEFVQQDMKPHKTIYLHFENEEDVQAFARLIGQTIKPNTKYLWFPEIKIGSYAGKSYVDKK